MKKILLIGFILGVSSFVLCSCGKKENIVAEYAPEEEMSAIRGEDNSTSMAEGKDLEDLQRDYEMDQYLICELPNDFTLGEFQKDITLCEGWLLEGEAEEPPHGEWTLEAWYCPGGIGRGETASEILKFENGALTDVSLRMNHSEHGEAEILEGCEVQAVLVEYVFDLFTASGWSEYLSQHPETEDAVLESHYWYVFLGKEDSEIFYVLFLNQEYFTKDDIVRMAQSVRFTEGAF